MFDPKTEPTNTNLHTFNPLEPIKDSYGALNFGSKTQKAAQNYEKYRNWNGGGGGGLQFRPENIDEDDESGVCSPPLWGNKSPSRSPVHSPKSGNNYFPHLSPSSRVQAIARGQLELMEMVKAMPESSYELSLKDLVESHSHRVGIQNQEECLVEEESLSKKGSVKRQESAKKIEKKGKMMVRSGSNIDENKGLFLKMVFPITLGGKKKKKKKKANPYAKVSPKPDGNSDNNNNKASKVVEKEWWKNRTSVSDESESGGISSNSRSTGSSGSSGSSVSSRRSTRSNSTRRKKNGCLRGFSPFYSKKSLPAK